VSARYVSVLVKYISLVHMCVTFTTCVAYIMYVPTIRILFDIWRATSAVY